MKQKEFPRHKIHISERIMQMVVYFNYKFRYSFYRAKVLQSLKYVRKYTYVDMPFFSPSASQAIVAYFTG
jgi:hypothetical protein